MKCFLYFFCCWFTFLTVGCASHRSEITNVNDQGTTTPAETSDTADTPPERPALNHEPLEGVKTLAGVVLAIPLAIVVVPVLWCALVLGSRH